MKTILERNNVTIFGAGRKVLMFGHGYGGDQTVWHTVAPAFEWDYKIVLFDYVGAGRSDASAFDPERYKSLRGYAQDVIDICHEFGFEQIDFVGHSVSGMIGALAAIMEPGLIANLIMIDPSPCYLNQNDYQGGFSRDQVDQLLNLMESGFNSWSTRMAPITTAIPDKPCADARFSAIFERTAPGIARHFARVTFLSDYRNDLPHLGTRTLILQTEEDVMAGVHIGQYIQRAVANSNFVLLNTNGHLPHLSAPELVIQEIQNFLQ